MSLADQITWTILGLLAGAAIGLEWRYTWTR